MSSKSTFCVLTRDILERHVSEEVLAVLLKDHSTGRNLIWATDDYAARDKGFGVNDEMLVLQIADWTHPVIRPRVDKNAEEQRRRSVKRAEVFTPSWICNKQLCTLFKLTKPESSYVTKTIRTLDNTRGKLTRSSTQNTASPKPSRSSSNP